MLRYSENGFDDIISTRSKIIKDQNVDIDSMKTNDLVEFIISNPSILKRPIIMSEEEIQVGYNDDDITLFLPLLLLIFLTSNIFISLIESIISFVLNFAI